ncbi:GNAT family N-acetyltransferase [Salipiger sp. 1_MG-2023]|uniref:GNAT family N-acetyltransferase n=1 Tax=Salipiger sp. 1_MG-2023 TaxID=3062665 RepID=UPI0026E2942A|nr:GNAT family N-acetyltransferase [Salipiger sp. 1_MG-2023]MDO6587062.1 GNAT family N-acetyltransferase [Salipiger sp. 1_MG-2023]
MTAAELAAISARAYIYMHPWAEADFTDSLAHPTRVLACRDGAFALGRVIVDEAEILALATDPAQQRAGQGRAVLAAFEAQARQRGAIKVFLEVAASNAPACAFYLAQGYAQTGRRRDYYAKPGGGRTDALLMSKALT